MDAKFGPEQDAIRLSPICVLALSGVSARPATHKFPSFSVFSTHEFQFTNHPSLRVLPGTVTRVESLLSDRKQSAALLSTWNLGSQTNLRQYFALKFGCGGRIPS
jgi:hypothetical protein